MDLVIHFIRKFKIPIIFVGLSVILFTISFFFTQKTHDPSDVIFTTEESSNSASLSQSITVDIAGEVVSPGVYSMEPTSRVNDLLEKAGGFTFAADTVWVGKHLNRAQLLHDGDKLYIPSIEDTKSDQSNSNSVENTSFGQVKININSATQSELENLPGIGEKTAVKIIEGRPYQDIQDLRSKKIVGEAVFEKIKDLISLL